MKVLLQKNISNLGKIGDLIEVKPGYARNYLLPQGLAVQPTVANVRTVEIAKQRYLEELAKRREELAAKASVVDGKAIRIEARANEEGHLYGSIGTAQIVDALAEQNVFVEPEFIVMEQPVRELGQYDIPLDFGPEVKASISLSVVSIDGEVAQELMEEPVADEEPAAEASEAPADRPAGEDESDEQ